VGYADMDGGAFGVSNVNALARILGCRVSSCPWIRGFPSGCSFQG
jgi:hypothetical protein